MMKSSLTDLSHYSQIRKSKSSLLNSDSVLTPVVIPHSPNLIISPHLSSLQLSHYKSSCSSGDSANVSPLEQTHVRVRISPPPFVPCSKLTYISPPTLPPRPRPPRRHMARDYKKTRLYTL